MTNFIIEIYYYSCFDMMKFIQIDRIKKCYLFQSILKIGYNRLLVK